MISNPNLIHYACIARGSVILGEYSSKEHEFTENFAQQCIDKTPPNHSMFTHTVCKRTYTFLIDGPFTFFAIFDESLERSESLWFLNRVKSAFEDMVESGSISDVVESSSGVVVVVAPGCFQARFDSVLDEMMSLDLGFLNPLSRSGSLAPLKDGRSSSVDSVKGGSMAVAPLLGLPQDKGLKKKKKRSTGEKEATNGVREINIENKVDVCDDVVLQKNMLYAGERQKAKQIWKKHVWIVLVLDLLVCSVLFGIWLWVCRGFQCIDR
ncbi:hypothetical protein JRO89_XS15G0026000 [Xanthoceras sorbifolium]|uniref:Longin domain-containing protein n=1 Tax=Xanthoceras sorbifolium TaxID=99658 RepID=A0ABQ8H0U2_9ROSI|nr:hypothetical protein JRO89_XS15G0026000 [Xanthoceras sorbifolium]